VAFLFVILALEYRFELVPVGVTKVGRHDGDDDGKDNIVGGDV